MLLCTYNTYLQKDMKNNERYQSHSASSGPAGSGLRADDLAGPGLVFRPWVEVCDFDLHGLHLQVFGRDPAHFVCDLIALDWDVLSFDAETETEMSGLNNLQTTLPSISFMSFKHGSNVNVDEYIITRKNEMISLCVYVFMSSKKDT